MSISGILKRIFKKILNLNPTLEKKIFRYYYNSIFYPKKHIKKNNYNWLNDIDIKILNDQEGVLKYKSFHFILKQNQFNSIPLAQKYLYANLITQFHIPKYYLLFWDDLVIFNEIFIQNLYEKKFQINNDDIIIDIGASIGWYTCKLSDKIGYNGKIISLEPDPVNFYYLEKNIKANHLTNIIALNIGVWSKKTTSILTNNKYISLIKEVKDLNEANENTQENYVKLDTIDDIISFLELAKVDLIKMDIEGAEIEAIKGAMNTLKEFNNIKLIIAAYHLDSSGKETYKTIIPILEKLKFKIYYQYLPYIYCIKK